MSDASGSGDETAKEVLLNETDRLFVWVAARLLNAIDPGPTRKVELERLIQDYRADLSDAHPGTDSSLLDDMAVNFAAALLRRMKQLQEGVENDPEDSVFRGTPLVRNRVREAIARYLEMVDPRH